MKYNELSVSANKTKKRVGRGISGGQGKTAGRGTKGQKSRTGAKIRATFQGGERSLVLAVPKKKGFKSIHEKAEVVYLDHFNNMSGEVDNFTLYNEGYITSPYVKVKVILRGDLKKKVVVKTQSASKTAIAAIKKAGGDFIKTAVPARNKTSQDK